jgi:hypothetical protein
MQISCEPDSKLTENRLLRSEKQPKPRFLTFLETVTDLSSDARNSCKLSLVSVTGVAPSVAVIIESASSPINGNIVTTIASIFFILFSPFCLLKNIQQMRNNFR